MKGCPHANIVHCPLYVVAHDGRLCGLTCIDDKAILWEGCAVVRGLDYHRQVGAILAVDPELVATLRWREDVAARQDQRARNMRLAGVH